MSKRAREIITSCYGCENDRPGQKDHMDVGGCLVLEEGEYHDDDDSRELEDIFEFYEMRA